MENQRPKNKFVSRKLGKQKVLLSGWLFLLLLVPVTPKLFSYVQKSFMNKMRSVASSSQEVQAQNPIQQPAQKKPKYSVPLEHFLVNLPQNQGKKLFKVEITFDVDNLAIRDEINKRMPQVRDIIIILLSSRKSSQIETYEGKELLKKEILDTVNAFLTKGRINRVLFTRFIRT